MNFAAMPPEVNSTRMYSGPGSGPMVAAAAAWDGLAAQLHSTATAYQSVIASLIGEGWLGPSSATMAAAVTPYVLWLTSTAAQAEQTATQARSAAAAYGTAFAMTVPPSVVAANRAQLLLLVSTNVLGQNTSAIAATEAHYSEMWAQDAAAMYGYAVSSVPAAELTPFAPPPPTTNPAGQASQAAANTQNAGSSVGSGIQTVLSQLTPATSNALTQAAPAAATPFPAQPVLPDLVGLDAVAGAGLTGTSIGVALSGGAWQSANQSTREILNAQDELYDVQRDILGAIDLFSPLTPSRPDGFAPGIPSASMSAAMGEAVSAGKLSVPISWAAAAPEIRTLSYTAPLAGPGVGAAPAASIGGAGTAFSQMALAGMGGSALAGSVSRERQDGAVTAPPGQRLVESGQESPENPVTGIAAEIREFAELRDRGLITRDEYNEQKLRLLGQ